MKPIKNLTFVVTTFLLSALLQSGIAQAGGKPQIEVTYTKWVTTFPLMEGIVGGDLGDGLFAGEVLNLTQKAGGQIWKIDARYGITVGDHTVEAVIHGTLNWQTGIGTLNGVVTADTEGSLVGARVHVKFLSIPDADHGFIYQGIITIMPN